MTQQPPAENSARFQTLLDERRDLFELLVASDAMLGLVHDINNNLNSMMLQASIVEMKVEEPLREEVAQIRRLGNDVARGLALVHQFRDRSRNSRTRVDLNDCVREVLADDSELARRFQAVFSDKSAPLLVNAAALKRLIRLLLSIVDASQPSTDVSFQICVESNERQIGLILKPARSGPEEDPGDWGAIPEGADGPIPVMERLALEGLGRLVEATLSARSAPVGGLSLAAHWLREGASTEPEIKRFGPLAP